MFAVQPGQQRPWDHLIEEPGQRTVATCASAGANSARLHRVASRLSPRARWPKRVPCVRRADVSCSCQPPGKAPAQGWGTQQRRVAAPQALRYACQPHMHPNKGLCGAPLSGDGVDMGQRPGPAEREIVLLERTARSPWGERS